MEDFTRLEIGLSHIAQDRYKVELRFWRPNDQVEYAPVSGIAQFALADFLWELSSDVYGQLLCERLFADARVLERFKEAYAVTEDRNTTVRVRLWIDPTASSLQQLHWETLQNPLTNSALLTNERSLFSRLLGSSDLRSVSLRAREDIRALIVIANPRNLAHYQLAPLESASELAHAQKSLELFSTETLVSDASHMGRVTLTNVIAQLGKNYDILYLVCHGALRDINGQGQLEPYLWFESENGNAEIVSGTEFVTRLRDLSTYPKLIFLASCQSANQEHEMRLTNDGVLPALGPQLVQMGIPAVVGMQGNISSETISRFSSEFFRELHHDGQVERAMAVARRTALMLKRSDWWMPVLFHRLKDGYLWFTDERSKRLFALLADHSSFLNDRLNSFVGRATELGEIEAHIQHRLKTGGYITITGQAGQGKSSIIAKLVDEYRKERYAFHFIPVKPGPDYQVGLLRNVMAHFILKYELSEFYVESESRSALRDYFPKVLTEVAAKGGQEVIFIDGLDQLEEDATGERDLSFLPRNPPPGVVFVLGTRPDDTLRTLESRKSHISYRLPNLSRHDFDLILQHRQVSLDTGLADRFYEAVQQNALYLDLVAKELLEHEQQVPEELIQKLTENPEYLFSLAIDRLKRLKEVWRDLIKPILSLLLVVQEPLSKRHMRKILDVDTDSLNEGLERLGGFVIRDEQEHYSLYHLKFRDFLQEDPSQPQKPYVFAEDEVEHWHEHLVSWCEQLDLMLIWKDSSSDLFEQKRRHYARSHYLAHLYYARQWQALFSVLDAGTFGHAKLEQDPSMRSYTLDLAWGERAAAWENYSREQGIDFLPVLWRYSLLRCRLVSRADSYPDEAFETMILLEQNVKAEGIAELLTNPVRKVRVLLLMARLLAERNKQQQEAMQLVKRAMVVASLIERAPDKDEALRVLASGLAEAQQWHEAERVIATIQNSDMQAWALRDLASGLAEAGDREAAEQQWHEAERVIATIQNSDSQAWALRDLASGLTEAQQWHEAERVIATIQNSYSQAGALRDLASGLTEAQQWHEAERIIATIQNSDMQAWALRDLASGLAKAQQWHEAERVIATIQNSDMQAGALRDLASGLAEAGDHEAAERLWHEAERIIATIQDSGTQVEALRDLASGLTETQQWQEAERIIASIQDSDRQAKALRDLADGLAQIYEWEILLRTIQRFWKSAKTNQEALSRFPLVFHFFPTHPLLGKRLHEAFTWIDAFLHS